MKFSLTTSLAKTSTRCALAGAIAAALATTSTWTSACAQSPLPSSEENIQPANPLELPAEVPAEVEEVPAETLESLPAPGSSIESPLVESSEDSVDTVNYADEEISVDYPAAWQLETLEDGILISSAATTPTELIATQIVRMAAPPGAVVNANIESFTAEGSAVARYSRATIDGQDALVMWLSDRPNEDSLESAIATFIGYEDETVFLFSRYASENTAAEASILQLHNSFTDPAASLESTGEADLEKAAEATAPADSSGE